MERSSSVIGGWSVAVTRSLSALGYDASGMLAEAGVDIATAYDPDTRFSSDHTRKLWQIAVTETGRADIGLEVARFVCPTTFHALGFSLWASETLLEALERMVRYNDLLNDGCTLSLQEGQGEILLIMDVHRGPDDKPQVASEGVDYFLGATVKLFRDIYNPLFLPRGATLVRAAPPNRETYLAYFGNNLQFEAVQNALIFDESEMKVALPTANPELVRENDKIVADYLARHRKQDMSSLVHGKLIELLALGEPSQEKIARALRTNVRTLQYRLKQQGTSYKQILNDTRHRLAVQYLKHSQTSVTEIAYLLGFSDSAHFNRAFKRWTGLAPGRYKQNL